MTPKPYLSTPRGGSVWVVSCPTCVVEYYVDASENDMLDAFDAYIEAMKSGALTPKKGVTVSGTITLVEEEEGEIVGRGRARRTRVQSLKEIDAIVRRGGKTLESLPKSVRDIIKSSPDRLVHYKFMPPTKAEYGRPIEDLQIPKALKAYLKDRGVVRLYKFQDDCFRAITNGENVVIAAPTAQGKTEGFILPIIKMLLQNIQDAYREPGVRAILMYPTKALARDQYEKLQMMCKATGLTVGIFDGDVSQTVRREMYRRPPDILLTNPDVLNYHLGWDRSRLMDMLHSVRYVVLDEIHLYTGSFGANIYYILKRLQMETRHPIQLIGASATIANPKEFAEVLFDDKVTLIESKQAKRGPIHFLMYYPEKATKYSMIVNLVVQLTAHGFRTLVFGNTHSEAEILNLIIRKQGVLSKVHRGGLSKKYRAVVESEFKSGKLPVLVSTPTLELGIDIGHLDSVVSMIVSVTRLTQRIGRAGRKGQESVAILALRDNDPISTFYRHQPTKYFTDIDAAFIEPNNEVVARYQLIAAALSGKLTLDDFPKQREMIEALEKEGLVKIRADGRVRVVDFARAQKTWREYNIRGIGDTVEIVVGGKVIGTRTMPMAAQELHPGAIYLHGGESYVSKVFKYVPGLGRAMVKKVPNLNEHTRPLYFTMPRIIDVHERSSVLGLELLYCTLELEQTVNGYVKVQTYPRKVLGKYSITPELVYKFRTRGFVFTAPPPDPEVIQYGMGVMREDPNVIADPAVLYGGTFHALEHVVIESSGMLTGGGTREIGGISMGDSGIIFVYDGSPGGNGASRLLFSRLEEAFKRVKTILEKCECTRLDGCPMCTYSYACGNNNEPLFKKGALSSVTKILAGARTTVDTEEYLGHEPTV